MIDAMDHFAILNLIHRYCLLIDSADWDALGVLFEHADVHYAQSGETISRDPARIAETHRRFVRLYPESGTPLTRHVSSNAIIEGDTADTARATSYITVFQAAPGVPLQPIACAQYQDRFARVAGGWRFTERRVDVGLTGDLSAHLLLPIDAA